MKYYVFLLIILIFSSFILLSFIIPSQNVVISRGEQLVNITLAKSAKIIQTKFNLRPSGTGAAMPGGPIQGLTLCFDTNFPLTKDQLRELLIKSARELLIQVTENSEIQQYLKHPPFVLENVQIILYNLEKDGREVYDPGISTAEIDEGILTFRSVDPDDTFKYKNTYTETYKEALEKIKKQLD